MKLRSRCGGVAIDQNFSVTSNDDDFAGVPFECFDVDCLANAFQREVSGVSEVTGINA